MHSFMESGYSAANAWLNSIGDDEYSDEEQYESTVASSPAELTSISTMSRSVVSSAKTMHACMFCDVYIFICRK